MARPKSATHDIKRDAILDIAAQRVEVGGIEAWSQASTEEILALVGAAADAPHYTKSTDILEVWFDSGTTHTTVLKGSHAGAGHDETRARLIVERHGILRGGRGLQRS